MTKNFLFSLILIVLAAFSAFAQDLPTPTPTPNRIETNIISDTIEGLPKPANLNLQLRSLETILSEAEKQAQNYREEFKNLLADETKTFQTYDKHGQPKNQKVIESTFLVYQSPKRQNGSVELRNVLKVDGEPVSNSQQRSEGLLNELQKTTTYEKELQKIQDESLRYDKTIEISGMTLSEAITLSANMRPFFDYQLVGTEDYEGSQVYVVSYQQNKKSPYIGIDEKIADTAESHIEFKLNLPGKLKNTESFLRGKLWIDAQTFQIRREVREVTVQTPTPVVVLRTEFSYQPSNYGLLLPKQIVLIDNNLKKVSNGNQYEPITDNKVTFDYKNFRQTNVDIKILDDTE